MKTFRAQSVELSGQFSEQNAGESTDAEKRLLMRFRGNLDWEAFVTH